MNKINDTYFNYIYSGNSGNSYNAVFSCNDSAGNYNSSSVDFSINFRDSAINFTYPVDGSEVIRGSNSIAGEDDKGVVHDSINLSAKVYDNNTLEGLTGAICYFYDNNALINQSITNS